MLTFFWQNSDFENISWFCYRIWKSLFSSIYLKALQTRMQIDENNFFVKWFRSNTEFQNQLDVTHCMLLHKLLTKNGLYVYTLRTLINAQSLKTVRVGEVLKKAYRCNFLRKYVNSHYIAFIAFSYLAYISQQNERIIGLTFWITSGSTVDFMHPVETWFTLHICTLSQAQCTNAQIRSSSKEVPWDLHWAEQGGNQQQAVW